VTNCSGSPFAAIGIVHALRRRGIVKRWPIGISRGQLAIAPDCRHRVVFHFLDCRGYFPGRQAAWRIAKDNVVQNHVRLFILDAIIMNSQRCGASLKCPHIPRNPVEVLAISSGAGANDLSIDPE